MNCAQGAMPRRYCLLSLFMAMSAASPALNAQGRGGSDWSTSGGDAHRSSWLRTDPKISPASIAKPGFQLIWKIKLKNDPRQSNSLTGPVLMDRYIGYRGFRSYAFIGGSADNAFTIDTDLGRIEWQKHFPLTSAPGSATCPGGMTAALTRPVTSAFPTVNPGRGGGGRGGAKSGVGEPFEGAITLSRAVTPRPRPLSRPLQPHAGEPDGGPGRMPEVIEGISSDGMLHAMYVSNGEERTPPMKFLPANAQCYVTVRCRRCSLCRDKQRLWRRCRWRLGSRSRDKGSCRVEGHNRGFRRSRLRSRRRLSDFSKRINRAGTENTDEEGVFQCGQCVQHRAAAYAVRNESPGRRGHERRHDLRCGWRFVRRCDR